MKVFALVQVGLIFSTDLCSLKWFRIISTLSKRAHFLLSPHKKVFFLAGKYIDTFSLFSITFFFINHRTVLKVILKVWKLT